MLEMGQLRAMLVELGMAHAVEILEAKFTSPTDARSSYAPFARTCSVTSSLIVVYRVRIRVADLPYKKLIAELIDDLCSLEFVTSASRHFLLVPPGTGKTHLAMGLAMEALTERYSFYCTTLSRIADDTLMWPPKRSIESTLSPRYWSLTKSGTGFLNARWPTPF
ncbi:MAG: ATP-binding protein [Actinomycetota bacterium]|nr:ATP-binding protein [Actinomycetota bacterium]